jgi:hypothetical protein
MSLKKVTTGQPISIKATTWNSFIDAALYAKQQQRAGGVPVNAGTETPATTVLVKNNTGAELLAYEVVGITGPIISAADNETEFTTRSGWNVGLPASSHFGKFLVTAESIPDGEMGLAFAGGVVPVKCDIDNQHMDRADVVAGNKTKLQASFHGSSQIIWKASDTGTAVWCAVRIGTPTTASVTGKANTTFTADGVGQVEVFRQGVTTGYMLENVYLDWMHGEQQVTSGKEVIATYFPYEQRWRLTGAECE